jgi:hypothetical protein
VKHNPCAIQHTHPATARLQTNVSVKEILVFPHNLTDFHLFSDLFNESVSSSDYTASNGRVTEWKECVPKRSWPVLRYYPGIRMEELRKTKKILRIVVVLD